jgi:hypothetical protein
MAVEITGGWVRAEKGIGGRIVLGWFAPGPFGGTQGEPFGSAQDKLKPRPPEERRRADAGNKWLLLEYQLRSADSLPFEVDYYLDAVGDLYQGDAFVHAIVLAVEGHRPCNLA